MSGVLLGAGAVLTGIVTGFTAVRAYGTRPGIIGGLLLWQATYWLGILAANT
jgi:hypothetical protein